MHKHFHHLKVWLVLGIFGAIAVVVLVATNAGAAQASSAPPSPPGIAPSTSGPRPITGVPAITPHITAANAAAAKTMPAFTTNDVVAYVAAHPIPQAVQTGPAVVKSIAFLTNQEASQRLGISSLGPTPDTLICWVELQVHATYYTHGNAITVSQVHELFDAHTGNFLGVGGK